MPEIPVTCPDCGEPLGKMVQVNDTIQLSVGDWIVAQGHRYCPQCGSVVYFRLSRAARWDTRMQRAAKRQGQAA